MGVVAAGYAAAATLAAPFLRRMVRRRAARGKELPARLPERFGYDSTLRPPGRLIWLHAASVGETLSVLPVIAALGDSARVLLTTGTVTSAALAAERLPPGVLHRFLPLDVPRWGRRFLDHWRPDAAAFIESEIWPNLLAALRARRIPAMLLNGRLSARSHSAWSRLPEFARTQFATFDAVLAQTEADATRLRSLGGRNVEVLGNLKLAADPLPVDEAELARLVARLAGRPVWLAASTHPGEEEVVLAAHAALLGRRPSLLTIVAPRHPDRVLPLEAPRRSLGQDPDGPLWVADTLGELGLLYRLAQAAFVGGSLVRHGGQNPLEPVRLGCPAAVGPHTANFADLVRMLEPAGLAQVTDATTLAAWVGRMLDNPDERTRIASDCAAAVRQTAELPRDVAARLLRLMR